MQKIIIAVLVIIAALSVILYLKTSEKDVHFHSGFQIYIDGKLQDYKDAKYMSLVPCNNDDHQVETTDKVHLHDGVGSVVHVHQSNVIWNDLFRYLKLDISKIDPVEAYVNGIKINSIAEEEIQPYDSLVLLLGKHEKINTYLDAALTKEYIHDAETKSGLCKG
ncbi:MAG: hypothetical protein ABIO02_02170 [Patescibacteria group bacterium]